VYSLSLAVVFIYCEIKLFVIIEGGFRAMSLVSSVGLLEIGLLHHCKYSLGFSARHHF